MHKKFYFKNQITRMFAGIFIYCSFLTFPAVLNAQWTIHVQCSASSGSCGSASLSQNFLSFSDQGTCQATIPAPPYCQIIYCPSECNGCQITSQSAACILGSPNSGTGTLTFNTPEGDLTQNPYYRNIINELGETASGINEFGRYTNFGQEQGTASFTKHYSTEFEDWSRETQERGRTFPTVTGGPPSEISQSVQVNYTGDSSNLRQDHDYASCIQASNQESSFYSRGQSDVYRQLGASAANELVVATYEDYVTPEHLGETIADAMMPGDPLAQSLAKATEETKKKYDKSKKDLDKIKKCTDEFNKATKGSYDAKVVNPALGIWDDCIKPEVEDTLSKKQKGLSKKISKIAKEFIPKYVNQQVDNATRFITNVNNCLK